MNVFLPLDKVKYTGRRFSKEIGHSIGEVTSKVHGSSRGYVVDFLVQTKEGVRTDSYVVDASNLAKHVPTRKESEQLEKELQESLLRMKLEAGADENAAKKGRRRTVTVA